jgi:type I restriction enzyme M protein
MTILRRLDCVLAPTKQAVHQEWITSRDKVSKDILDVKLRKKSGYSFYNTSEYTIPKLVGDSANVKANLLSYLDSFSDNIRDVFTRFGFEEQIQRLEEANALYLVLQRFAALDLRPENVSNTEMGTVFEELIRKFAEASNETAGEHFTPREVIALMVDLLLVGDEDATSTPNIIRTVYDPAAGTGGMLSVMDEHLRQQNETARLTMAGQEINPSSYAVCKADMIIKGQDVNAIALGNTLTDDQHASKVFHYCLSNPPFGVEWRTSEREIRKEHKQMGFDGRFGSGLPGVSDGSMLFLLHLISKMRPADPDHAETRGRAAIVLNGSPLFTGKAGSGESEIRRWIVESDLLDAIVALPTDMFYNTGIPTYIWVLDQNKPPERRGKIQLIDASDMFTKMRKSLGSKRKELPDTGIETIVRLYGTFDGAVDKRSKIFDNMDFGYRTITVERPLRLAFQATPDRIDAALESPVVQKLENETVTQLHAALQSLDPNLVTKDRSEFNALLGKVLGNAGIQVGAPVRKALISALSKRDQTAEICRNSKGEPEADPKLRSTEDVPLNENIHDYLTREVIPHIPDAWIDESKTRIGYEIPFTKHFYEYKSPRTLKDIDAELDELVSTQEQLVSTLQKQRTTAIYNSVPADRKDVRLKYLTTSVRQGFSPQCETVSTDGITEWAVLKVGCVNGGIFRPGENKRLPGDIDPRPDLVVNRGDLVVSRANTRDLVGSAAIVQGEYPRLMLSDKTYAIALDENKVIPEFVALVLGTPKLRQLIELEATGASHSMQNISQADILNLPIPLPALDEQRDILTSLSAELTRVDNAIRYSKDLMDSLRERRAALITTAVMGPIDEVPALRGE